MSLTDDDRRALEALPCSLTSFARDDFLVREGEPATACNLLVRGYAYRQKLVRDGSRQIISIHIPGEFVDLQNCLLGVADHNVQCLTRAEVAIVPRAALSEVVSARPGLTRALWLDTLIDASIFREWVVNVGRRSARARIAHLLCELAMRQRHSSGVSEPACE